jgi:3-isopropylmalate/(R)-2-methylmalate dehydratase small subunit
MHHGVYKTGVLKDWGFDAIISSKFADIFKLNSINIGLVPIETTEENMDILFDKVNLNSNVEINISINEKKVTCEELEFDFVIDNFSQNRILNGIDKIDISLDYSNMIEEFKENRSTWMPKLTD